MTKKRRHKPLVRFVSGHAYHLGGEVTLTISVGYENPVELSPELEAALQRHAEQIAELLDKNRDGC